MRPEHLSVTQKGMFERCPLQYWFRYVKGVKTRPSAALRVGSRTHETLEVNFSRKMKEGTDLPLDRFCGDWEERFSEDVKDTSVDWEQRNPGEYRTAFLGSKVSVRDAGRTATRGGLLPLIRNTHCPPLHPQLVEERFELVVEPGLSIVGVIDFYGIDAHGKLTVRDWKVGGAAKPQSETDVSHQLTLYHHVVRKQGLKVQGVAHDFMVHGLGKGKQSLVPRESKRTVKQGDQVIREFKALRRQLDNLPEDAPDLWPRTPPESWWCSEKWCGYWSRCPRGGGKYET